MGVKTLLSREKTWERKSGKRYGTECFQVSAVDDNESLVSGTENAKFKNNDMTKHQDKTLHIADVRR